MSRSIFSRLWFRLAAVIAACAIIAALAIVPTVNANNFEKHNTEQTCSLLLSIAQTQAAALERLVADIREDFEILSQNPQYQNQFTTDRNCPAEADRFCFERFYYEKNSGLISKLYRIGPGGNVLYVHPFDKDEIGENFASEQDISYVIKNHKPLSGQIVRLESENAFSICYPVFDNNGFIGIVRGVIPFENIRGLVRDIKAGEQGYAWLIDEKAVVISHPNDDYIGKPKSYIVSQCKKGSKEALSEIIDDMSRGAKGQGSYEFTQWQDGSFVPLKKIVAYHPVNIGDFKWSIAVCMNYDEISGPVKAHWRNVWLIAAFVTLVMCSVTAGYYIDQIRQRKEKANLALSEAGEKLRLVADDHNQKALKLEEKTLLVEGLIKSMPYAMFWKNTEAKYKCCNERFIELTNLKQPNDIVGKTDYEIGWDEQQAKQLSNAEQQVMKSSIGLTNLERKINDASGRQIRVITNSVPLTDQLGRVFGVMGIYIDADQFLKNLTDPQTDTDSSADIAFNEEEIRQINELVSNNVGFAELLQAEELANHQEELVSDILDNARSCIDILSRKSGGDSQNKPESTTVENNTYKKAPQPQSEALTENKEKSMQCSSPEEQNTEKQDAADVQEIGSQKKPAILIVDDVEENRMLASLTLGKEKYNIDTAENGKIAVEMAEKHKYDVILMDVQMPEMDGLEATKKIRGKGFNTASSIIAMTAGTNKEDEIICLEAGCDDYIPKPVKHEQLVRKISRAIGKNRQLQEAESEGDISSLLSDSEDYKKTIERFIESLPEKIQQMQEAIQQNKLDDLAALAHAMKGLGSFAGFPVYTQKAKELEENIKCDDIENVRQKVDELARLCMRTRIKQNG